jgi:hypothetical protein
MYSTMNIGSKATFWMKSQNDVLYQAHYIKSDVLDEKRRMKSENDVLY